MKKAGKVLGVIGLTVGACCAVSLAHEYRKMKKVERALDALPLHQLKKRLSHIKKESGQTVISIPDDMLFVDKLRVCASILSSKSECCEQ